MKRIAGILAVLLGAGLVTAGSSDAATIFFNNQSAWTSAVSGITTETYESYDWNSTSGVLLGTDDSVTLGGITYTFFGLTFGVNGAAVSYDADYLSGNYLEWQPNPADMTISLPGPVTAIAFRYGEFYGNSLNLTVNLGNGDSTTVGNVPKSYSFFGAVSDTPFDVFTLNADRDFLIIDDLSQATALDPVPVPEPSMMLLLGSGFAGLAGYGRRRMNRQQNGG